MSRLPASGCKLEHPSAILSAASSLARRASRRPSPGVVHRRPRATPRWPLPRSSASPVRQQPRRARSTERSSSGGRLSHAGTARARPADPPPPAPDRPAGSRQGEIDGRERCPEVLHGRQEVVVSAANARTQLVVVPLAETWRTTGPLPPHLHRELVEAPGAGARAEHAEDLPVRREAEPLTRLRPGERTRALGNRPPDDQVLRRPASSSYERRARRTAPRAGWRGRDAHRPRSVPSGSASSRRQGPSARRRSSRRRERRPAAAASGIRRLSRTAPPTRKIDRELDAGPARQPRSEESSSKPASGTRRASTRSGDPANVTAPAVAKRLADGDRRQHVSGCSSCCDQAPGPWLLGHGRPRC